MLVATFSYVAKRDSTWLIREQAWLKRGYNVTKRELQSLMLQNIFPERGGQKRDTTARPKRDTVTGAYAKK